MSQPMANTGEAKMDGSRVAVQTLAEQPPQDMAVKVLRASLLNDMDLRRQFRREFRLLSQFSHPNIVRLTDGDPDAPFPWIATERIEGQTLTTLMEEKKAMSVRSVMRYGQQLASALTALHKIGIAHRDLTPENVLLTSDGDMKIIDLGLGIMSDETILTQECDLAVTLRYAPPEVLDGAPHDGRGDLYQLGLLLYLMLTGPLYFRKVLKGRVQRPSARNRAIPAALDRLVLGLLARDPAHRPPTAQSVEHSLQSLIKLDSGRSDSGSARFGRLTDQTQQTSWSAGVPTGRPGDRRSQPRLLSGYKRPASTLFKSPRALSCVLLLMLAFGGAREFRGREATRTMIENMPAGTDPKLNG